ncbi:MAG: hypothetical protein ACLSTO_11570 [Bilophila wadsworthia]
METLLIDAEEMCKRLGVNKETFRRSWRRWKHERVGAGYDLRSMRFYWCDGRQAEATMAVSKYGQKAESGGRRTFGRTAYDQKAASLEAGGNGMGNNIDLSAEARRFGLA